MLGHRVATSIHAWQVASARDSHGSSKSPYQNEPSHRGRRASFLFSLGGRRSKQTAFHAFDGDRRRGGRCSATECRLILIGALRSPHVRPPLATARRRGLVRRRRPRLARRGAVPAPRPRRPRRLRRALVGRRASSRASCTTRRTRVRRSCRRPTPITTDSSSSPITPAPSIRCSSSPAAASGFDG